MTFDKDTPLSRIKGETQKAHNALMDYFLMPGGGRSLAKLHQKYIETTLNEPPSKNLRTLAGWSTRYHWQARIAQQAANDNAVLLDQRRQALEKIEAEFRERHMSEAEALSILAGQARGDTDNLAQKALEMVLKHHGSFAADNKAELVSKIEVIYGDRDGQPEKPPPKTD